FLDDADALEGSHTRLSQKIVFEKQTFSYVYDFGDYWEHSIQLVKFVDPKRTFYPKCIKGERNSPPEDCGGVRGFQTFKEIMKDKKHPEHKEMIVWNDGPFDEDFFSLLFINDDFKHFDTMVKASLEFDEEEE
ncbi:MAG: plasmid pRiA4b ORF-3 family protein, partial [Sulfurospirillum sp.]|nr:plasmid pRiA4b ORF-3 family protein [Sulfurospirillum sp.]